MPNYTIDDVVDFVMDKDHLNLKAAIDDIMTSRVNDALEQRKEFVGRNMFAAPEELEHEDGDPNEPED
jgi:hypothetical protein